ncbi:hypothetical protein VC83_07452 [Pseudogymnoascus destructans]|uniref:Reverse transcriptase domain-containing protein n=2 Tax=Pseudogymnoascus destructans TaxID=655981 RepID=L8G1C9_PSED2|nr:uncharacterized protein VC83_07452 [Pseudogymnoascus destructans]ELR06513.1 hypothetical protein GMDG_02148 [Pseudogymnoascus destructans 20631-21]OAF56148.1 hypothetical protein VC83_07452 [Pseudogymnoascus destructans]
MASTDVISQVLDSITSTKLQELSKLRVNFELGKAELLELVDAEEQQSKRVLLLLDKGEKLCTLEDLGGDVAFSVESIRCFIKQAQHDPSVSLGLQKEWEVDLRRRLDVNSLRFEYAAMYGNLVTEWLENPLVNKNDTESASYQAMGRAEMHEQRSTWESYVFTPLETDIVAINSYLDQLFTSSKYMEEPLKVLRESTRTFEKSLSSGTQFDEETLKWIIGGILGSDGITDAKRTALTDFANNKTVLKELADVLNMRMRNLDTWSWGVEGTPVEQRRQLNGRYRFYHDEDLLQAIFLRYIGCSWSAHLKAALTTFTKSSKTWIHPQPAMTKAEISQWSDCGHSLRTAGIGQSVQSKRATIWRDDVFLEQLQSRADETPHAYNDDNSDDCSDVETKSPQKTMQTVLRLLETDIIMKTRLGEDVTVVRSDFKWFGPSLAHSSMFTVLRYYGVSDRWIGFFKRALEAPMQLINDGPDAPIQIRKRGTPISGPLSDVLGESVLFCLDFDFNQRTNGAFLWRLHDDIWFWGDKSTCETGWNVMTEFSELMGLDFAEDKTGSVQIAAHGSQLTSTSSVLPAGDVVWGFLKLDAESGRFVINQNQVDKHIKELSLQLRSCKCVFDWIQAWNIYATRFFTTNFGRPANCFGRAHVDEILETFKKIQKQLFTDEGNSVTSVIKKMLSDRFGIQDIPEGYIYFPSSLGGLEVQNPFIGPNLVRESLPSSPHIYMDEFFRNEVDAYQHAKETFESTPKSGHELKDSVDFLTFEEYTRYREFKSSELAQAFDLLMEEPQQLHLEDFDENPCRFLQDNADPYRYWIMQLYAAEMVRRFGGLNVVQPGLLPMGMVTMFKTSRFQWRD